MRSLLGVNLPYFYGSYGHDLAPSARFSGWPCDFDVLRAYRPLLEARELGFDAVRIWLCEGAEGLVVDRDGDVDGVHPKLLESLRILEEGAALTGVRLYFCLLDANAAARDGDPITRAILATRDGSARFAERVVAPLVRALDPRLLVGLEIVNEPEVLTEACRDSRQDQTPASVPWETLGAAISLARRAALAERPGLVVTSGTSHVFLPDLWRSGAELDAIDVHIYHSGGGLPSRDDLVKYAVEPALASESIPLLAGECGIPKEPPPDEPHALVNYLLNADSNRYAAAFLWKLEGDLVDTTSPERRITSLGLAVQASLRKRPVDGFR